MYPNTGDAGGIVSRRRNAIRLSATEGVPLTLTVYGHDSDSDLINWQVTGLPRGMVFTPAGSGGNRETLAPEHPSSIT